MAKRRKEILEMFEGRVEEYARRIVANLKAMEVRLQGLSLKKPDKSENYSVSRFKLA